jgi:nitric oxide reductase subunit B
MAWSFWGLNIGLAYMIFVNLFPAGALQFADSVQNGYWHARQPEFFATTPMRVIEWLRLPGDLFFILAGIVPVVYLAVRMWLNRKRQPPQPEGAETEEFVQFYEGKAAG